MNYLILPQKREKVYCFKKIFSFFLRNNVPSFSYTDGTRTFGGDDMEQILKLGSVSNASKAKRVLNDRSIKGRLTKTSDTAEGCAWGIAVAGRDAERAVRILRAEGIRYEAL